LRWAEISQSTGRGPQCRRKILEQKAIFSAVVPVSHHGPLALFLPLCPSCQLTNQESIAPGGAFSVSNKTLKPYINTHFTALCCVAHGRPAMKIWVSRVWERVDTQVHPLTDGQIHCGTSIQWCIYYAIKED
jgi:hypothetical protein